ncbi:MAG: hypothetical protein ACREJQ_01600 [bacterium]
MRVLTRRAQVLFSPDQYRMLERQAKQRGVSVGALIRELTRVALSAGREERLEAVHDLAGLRLPAGSPGRLKKEILAGSVKG